MVDQAASADVQQMVHEGDGGRPYLLDVRVDRRRRGDNQTVPGACLHHVGTSRIDQLTGQLQQDRERGRETARDIANQRRAIAAAATRRDYGMQSAPYLDLRP